MDIQCLNTEEVCLFVQWREELVRELWELIVYQRLRLEPVNHPHIVDMVLGIKAVWWRHFRCIEVKPNLVLFLPDPAIKLRQAMFGSFAHRRHTHCMNYLYSPRKKAVHPSYTVEVIFYGRRRDQQRMQTRTAHLLPCWLFDLTQAPFWGYNNRIGLVMCTQELCQSRLTWCSTCDGTCYNTVSWCTQCHGQYWSHFKPVLFLCVPEPHRHTHHTDPSVPCNALMKIC